MSQMGITCFATDFRTYHSVSGICFLLNQLAVNRLGETGPSATGIELIGRDEQRLTRSNIHIDARTVFIPVGITERRFGGVFLGNGILFCGELESAKLLQKSEMRKNMVMDLIYRGFINAANYSESHYNPRRSQIKTELRYLFVTTPNR